MNGNDCAKQLNISCGGQSPHWISLDGPYPYFRVVSYSPNPLQSSCFLCSRGLASQDFPRSCEHGIPCGFPLFVHSYLTDYTLCDTPHSYPSSARFSPTPSESPRFREMDAELHRFVDGLGRPSSSTVEHNQANRQAILTCLNYLARHWVQQKAAAYKLDHGDYAKFTFVRAFGSCGLGLFSENSDLDAVLIVPRFISREEFFSDFLELIRRSKGITDIFPIESTFVPVIKFEFYGVEVDLTFAVLGTLYVPDEDALLSDDIVMGMDGKSKKSLNGWRVCQYLLAFVPDVKVFRAVLTLVKHWASQRLIYSNTLGYLGGVSWAILVAFMCSLSDGAPAIQVLKYFFDAFSSWNWTRPVNINVTANPDAIFEGRNTTDYVMQIITPCAPPQNSSFNVTKSTLQTIRQEMQRASLIMTAIEQRASSWDLLVTPQTPVGEYVYFLTITAFAKDEARLKRWKGVVESRFRQLLQQLERLSQMRRCQIFPKTYVSSQLLKVGETHCFWVIGLDHPKGPTATKDAVTDFLTNLDYYKLMSGQNQEQRVQIKGHNAARVRNLLGV